MSPNRVRPPNNKATRMGIAPSSFPIRATKPRGEKEKEQMASKQLKQQVLKAIIDRPGITQREVYKKFKDVRVVDALGELFYDDKMYALSSVGGCYACLNAKDRAAK